VIPVAAGEDRSIGSPIVNAAKATGLTGGVSTTELATKFNPIMPTSTTTEK
jgi:hypothetical protein